VPLLDHSHAAYMIIRGIEAVAKSKDNFSSTKKTTLAGLFALPPDIVEDHQRAFETQLGLYQKYERGIEAVARQNNVKTAYFLQPIPPYGKTLTEREKANVGDTSYRDLYRRMVDGMMTLSAKGLPMFDLGDIYKDETGEIYADQIHCIRGPEPQAESRGYTIMAERIAEDLAKVWGLKEKPAN